MDVLSVRVFVRETIGGVGQTEQTAFVHTSGLYASLSLCAFLMWENCCFNKNPKLLELHFRIRIVITLGGMRHFL